MAKAAIMSVATKFKLKFNSIKGESAVRIFLIFLFFAILNFFRLGDMSLAYAGEGHDAGYEWAQEHDITDTEYSNGNSDSFNEGVRQYAEEQEEENKEE